MTWVAGAAERQAATSIRAAVIPALRISARLAYHAGEMVHRFPALALAALLPLLAASGARAQGDPLERSESDQAEARQAFRDGRAAFDEGRYEAALELFTRAYDLSHLADLLYNIALAHDRMRHDREALEVFRRYLDAVPAAANRPAVESRIRVLEAEIAREEALLAQANAPRGEEIWESPIFWTILGIAVAGAAVGVGVGVAVSSDPGVMQPSPGPSGVLVFALE